MSSRFFGIHAPGLPDAYPKTPRGAVNLTTNAVYWPQLETSAGHFDFSRLDAIVSASEKHHAKPLLILGQTPKFHSKTPGAAVVGASVPKMKPWKKYVSKVVGRYKTRLDYQIWPEANIIQNWTGTPKQLAQLTVAASKIIHKRARKAVVVGPAMVTRMKYQRTFMDRFYATRVGGKRVGSFVDVVGIDAYPKAKGTPEDSFAIIRQARNILRRHKVRAPMWNLEVNYGVIGGHATVASRWSNRKQASYVVRNDMLDAAAGIKRVYWLGWFPFKEGTIQLVKADGVTPTLAAKALGVVRTWLIHQHVRSCARKKHTRLWTCTLVRSGRTSHVYWTTKGKTRVRAPKGSRHVATMTGDVRRTHARKRLTVTTSPIRVYH